MKIYLSNSIGWIFIVIEEVAIITTVLTTIECLIYLRDSHCFFACFILEKMTSLIVTNPNESYSAVVRSNQAVLAAVSLSGDEVVAEFNETYGSTQNEVSYEECDNFQHSSTYASISENVA